jgi:DNA-binding response OmpR family regulator
VALTAYGSLADKRRALDAGYDEHLVKPAGLEALEALLRSVGNQ